MKKYKVMVREEGERIVEAESVATHDGFVYFMGTDRSDSRTEPKQYVRAAFNAADVRYFEEVKAGAAAA